MAANSEVNARNILAIKEHSETTRVVVRELQAEIAALKNEMAGLRLQAESANQRINGMLVKIHSGGATS